jgi:hypothetical protein
VQQARAAAAAGITTSEAMDSDSNSDDVPHLPCSWPMVGSWLNQFNAMTILFLAAMVICAICGRCVKRSPQHASKATTTQTEMAAHMLQLL